MMFVKFKTYNSGTLEEDNIYVEKDAIFAIENNISHCVIMIAKNGVFYNFLVEDSYEDCKKKIFSERSIGRF